MVRKKILYCKCSYTDLIPKDTEETLMQGLKKTDSEVYIVPDLCKFCTQKDSFLSCLEQEEFILLACYPRGVRNLLAQSSILLHEKSIILNTRNQSGQEILEKIQLPPGGAYFKMLEDRQQDWIPWFPIIDYKRCQNCKQCLNFCLFGVYETDKQGKIRVAKPQNCKNNCPACARICPEVAIVFPKYTEDPINGSEILDEEKERIRARENIENMLGSDPYTTLLQRRRKKAKLSLIQQNHE